MVFNAFQWFSMLFQCFSMVSNAFGWFSMLLESGFNWRAFNQQITFKPFSMTSLISSTQFNAPRLSWSSGKDFVVSASLQAEPVVLDSVGMSADKIFAQAVSDGVDSSAQTVPLSLVSLAEDTSSSPSYQSSALLPAGTNVLKYSTNALFGGPKSTKAKLSSSFSVSFGIS